MDKNYAFGCTEVVVEIHVSCCFIVLAKVLADYYIISGVVYRAPDLFSVVNSRLVSVTYVC